MEPDTFEGTIGRYYWESTSWWPEEAPHGPDATNVLLVVLDDVGFAQLGCFGSSIDTPVIDALAGEGLRYTNFHTTGLCSPTRSCVLTGRNHHTNGMGRIAELAAGFPGYDGRIPKANGFLSEILLEHGYATFAVGKWHLTPESETNLAATRARWPLGRGFERFYGFHGGETHQFSPSLVHDNHFVEQPNPTDRPGYHLTEDLVDQALVNVADLRAIDADKPFLLYFATGACHSPHQAPAEWIERYRGHFDHGWDLEREHTLDRQKSLGVLPEHTELSPRPEWVPAWDELSDDERAVYARFMEAFAGYLSHTDAQLGRLLDGLAETGDLDRTLVVLLSDNGASSEGGPTGSVNDARAWNVIGRPVEESLERIDEIGGPRLHNNYPWGWTVAGNTPFRRWKREVHEGGVADPMIVRLPGGSDRPAGTRTQYVHAVDITPTVLDVLGITAPDQIGGVAQTPMAGESFASSFDDAGAPARRTTQYFEMFGCQALYHEGWKAVTYHPMLVVDPRLDEAQWELYDVVADPSECHDLADQEPERLARMVERWWAEADRFGALPIDNRPFSELILEQPHPPSVHRGSITYRPGAGMVPEEAVPKLFDRTHSIRADVEIPEEGAQGVLLALGNLQGGFSFFVQDGRLAYVHNLVGLTWARVDAAEPVTAGEHSLGFRYERSGDGGGTVTLSVDDRVVGSGRIDAFTPMRWNLVGAGLTCGADPGLPVCDDYEAPFRFTGTLHRAVLEVVGDAASDPKAEIEIAIARQ